MHQERIKTAAILLLFLACVAQGAEAPPINVYLADSNNPMAHGNPSQQDSVVQAGPMGPSLTLTLDQIDYVPVGPGHFGTTTSGLYADNKRVFWGNGLDRIVKIDHDGFKVLATYYFPGAKTYGEEEAEEAITQMDESNDGLLAQIRGFMTMLKYRDLSAIYTLLDREHNYYIGDREGNLIAYGDADPTDSASAIVKLRATKLPAEITGFVMGLSITYDGWLLIVTEHGWVVAIKRDFSETRIVRMLHSEGAEDKATGPTGRGWIRNAPAIDSEGGIYIVSQAHMHKVVWDGVRLSTDPTDGAWTAPYDNTWGHGSGATPSLMGFGDEDQLVVITDGAPQMNVVAYWRNDVPRDWPGLPGQPRQVAGLQPVTMGNPDLTEIQSEQSVVVEGYGALVVNNEPRHVPWYVPSQARGIFYGLLGSNPRHQPFGVEKFEWNPDKRILEQAWVTKDISTPSAVPIVSSQSNLVYLIGARNNQFTLEAMNWQTGESCFHYVIGGQRYNVMYAGTLIDEAGRIHYGSPWGRVRLNTEVPSTTPRQADRLGC